MDKAITWDQLADLYQLHTGKKARTQPMEEVAAWAESRKDLFTIHPIDETIHLKEKNI